MCNNYVCLYVCSLEFGGFVKSVHPSFDLEVFVNFLCFLDVLVCFCIPRGF